MATTQRADIEAAVSRMGSTIGARRELGILEEQLGAEEIVTAMVATSHGPGNGLLVLTNERVFFVFEGMVRQDFVEFSFDQISAVEWKSAVNLGTITLYAGGEAKFHGVDKDGGEVFVA
ncbi:MAG TPA: PH domain-containing protein, partial [Micromonosporaceae bacterium]